MSLKETVKTKIYPIRAALCVFTSSAFGSEDIMKKDYEEIRKVIMGLSEEEGKVLPEILPPHQIEALSRLFEEGPKEEHVQVFVSGKKRNAVRQKERELETNSKMLSGAASNEELIEMGMFGGKPSDKYFTHDVSEEPEEKKSGKPKRKKRSAEETKALLAAMVNGGGDAPEDEASTEPEAEAPDNVEPEPQEPPKNDKADDAMNIFAGLLR